MIDAFNDVLATFIILLVALSARDWITIVAIIAGPILAVLANRAIDTFRRARSRRMEIFRALMRTRRNALHSDNVDALNLVEVEFAAKPKVMTAFRDLVRHLEPEQPRLAEEETHAEMTLEEKYEQNRKYL